jgi:ATP-dependent DNA helicase RecG
VQQYIEGVKAKTRSTYLLKLNDLDILNARHIITDNTWSLMGTLCFDEYPQRFFPKLRMTYLSYASDQIDPHQRYLDNKTFEGPIEEMITTALQYIKLQLPERYEIRGSEQVTRLQVPEVALREALINAVAHRDYSAMALSREIQIRVTPTKISIENPGGLFGGSRIDSLKTHNSICRNSYLATLLEDIGIMENRGDGILSMCQAMKDNHLPEPLFYNFIDTFCVSFLRMEGAQERPSLTPKEFLSKHREFRRRDVIEELGYTIGEAKYFIKTQLAQGTIRQAGRGRGTRYHTADTST